MLTNSGSILFKNMAAQNIDLNIISGKDVIYISSPSDQLSPFKSRIIYHKVTRKRKKI